MRLIALFCALTPLAAALNFDTLVLYQNDGNWTHHGTQPSALLARSLSSQADAYAVCQSLGETLSSGSLNAGLNQQLDYQTYAGALANTTGLWTADGLLDMATRALDARASASGHHYVLCTNEAPFVSSVNTTFVDFPYAVAAANGTTFTGLRDHLAFRFMGIPFAQPPVGNLRFADAQAWNGSSVNATSYAPACLQSGPFDGEAYGINPWGNSEDCLYLNVFTPAVPSNTTQSTLKLKPVMVYVFGGGQTQGSGSDSTFDGASFVSRNDVVLVTFNYRLSIFGYLSLNDTSVPGNAALTDKVAALAWVQTYIRAFGGDPDRVTIFGQSAGAGAVAELLISPKAAGLFHGAILQSTGGAHITTQTAAAANVVAPIAALCNSTTGADRLTCLRALPAETVFNITTLATSWDSVIDGVWLTDYSVAQVAKGRTYVNGVNYMAGFMPDEYQNQIGTEVGPTSTNFTAAMATVGLSAELVSAITESGLWPIAGVGNGSSSPDAYSDVYNATINAATDDFLVCPGMKLTLTGAAARTWPSMHIYRHSRAYGLSYADWYDLCTFPVGEPTTPYYKCHAGDLYFVFGTAYLFDLPVRDDDDVYYANAVMDMWGSFARSGSPNVDADYLSARGYDSTQRFFSNFTWLPFTAAQQNVAYFAPETPSLGGLADVAHCDVLLPFIGA